MYNKTRSLAFLLLIHILLLLSCLERDNTFVFYEDPIHRIITNHYTDPTDSLKLKAASFLFSNMQWHHGQDGPEIRRYTGIFDIIDSLSVHIDALSNNAKLNVGDSIVRQLGVPNSYENGEIQDQDIITADYLITNIDYAFKAWTTAPWAKKISFSDFCEYILPYRIRDERLELYRPKFYNDYLKLGLKSPNPDSLNEVFNYLSANLNIETTFDVSFYPYFPFTQSIDDIFKGRIGGCETTSLFGVAVMRSIGLPVALDFIPHWGNSPNMHYMVGLAKYDSTKKRLSNKNSAINTWSIVDFSTEYWDGRHIFTENDVPKGLYIQYTKAIPKVFRHSFSSNEFLKGIIQKFGQKNIAPAFNVPTIKDVTNQYLDGTDVRIRIAPQFNDQPIYMCVFDIDGWHPVDIALATRNEVLFRCLGRNIVYLPMIYRKNVLEPAAMPLLLDTIGTIHSLNPNLNSLQNLKLLRKTALFAYTAYHTDVLKDGRFEGSNDPEFKNPTLLHAIDYYPFYHNEVSIIEKNTFRYLRFVAPPNNNFEPDNIAEMTFFGSDSTILQGSFIGNKGSQDHGPDKAFDNNILTYYENADYRNGWIGIDLGKKNRSSVSKISFCPRNDANCIIPGNTYELYYWDDTWKSLGQKRAKAYELTYSDVPTNALFWLRCLTEGKEERIFIYKDDMQIWF